MMWSCVFLYLPAATGCASWAALSSPDRWRGASRTQRGLVGAAAKSRTARPPVYARVRTEMARQREEAVSGGCLAIEAPARRSRTVPCRDAEPDRHTYRANPGLHRESLKINNLRRIWK